MKKYMTVALAAMLAVSVAAVGIAQTERTHTMDAQVIPTDAGTKKKPKNGTASIGLKTDPAESVTVDTFSYFFPKQVKISTAGLKNYCTVAQISNNGNVPPAKCEKAEVGGGVATAFVGSRTGLKLTLQTTLYAAKSGLTVYVAADELPDVRKAFPATFEEAPEGYGQALVADVPEELEFPAPSTPAILDTVDLKIGPKQRKVIKRRDGKRRRVVYRLVSVRGCAGGDHDIGTRLEYADDPRDASPAPGDTFATATSPCTK